MKKVLTLLLAAGLVFGAATSASAIDFKGKGYWSYSLETTTNNKFANESTADRNDDAFSAGIRLRLQLDAVASESLSGVVYFEIGDVYYGQASKNDMPMGGALGADGTIVEVKRAYLDWTVPSTDLKLRMGIQGMKLPLFASEGNFVLDDDAAGITANYKFNDKVGLTGMWTRLLNDNTLAGGTGPNVKNTSTPVYIDTGYAMNMNQPDNDAFDFFSLLLPMKFEGIRVTPWVGLAAMGDGIGRNPARDYGEFFVSTSRKKLTEGMGVYTGEGKRLATHQYGGGETYTWWAGLSGDLSYFDPFTLKFDFIYGNKGSNGTDGYRASDDRYYFQRDNGTARRNVSGRPLSSSRYERKGWFGSILAEYKLDYFTPGIFLWYSSGDDSNVRNGSERLPAMSGNWEYTHTGFKGTLASGAYDGLLAYNPIGLWGIALQARDISFMDSLKNHMKVVYMRGTNSASMPKNVLKEQVALGAIQNAGDFAGAGITPTGGPGSYLTTQDWALEVNLDTEYKIYENLKLVVEMAYIHLDFDRATWKPWINGYGRAYGNVQTPTNPDAFKVGLNIHYTF